MVESGRNDPCPCGSGKKYKQCCAALRALAAPENDPCVPAVEKLLRFGAREEFQEAMAFGMAKCLGLSSDLEKEDLLGDPITPNLMSYLHYDAEIEDGKTLIGLFLERRGSSLLARERGYLEQLAASRLGLYEVIGIAPGVGVHLRDLWTGDELRVEDGPVAEDVKLWDLAIGRVIRTPGGSLRFESDVFFLSTDAKTELLARLEEDRHEMAEVRPEVSTDRFLKLIAFRYFEFILRGPEDNNTVLVTRDGELIEPTIVTFAILNEAAVINALNEAYEEDEGHWLASEIDADGVVHAHGSLAIEEDQLILDTWTSSRAAEERYRLEDLCPDELRHLETRTVSYERYLEESQEDTEARTLDDEEIEAAQQALEQHYRRWIDESIPALQDRTPREVACDESHAGLKADLVELLKKLENREARLPAVEGCPYDFGWIWKELGLERPVAGKSTHS